MQLPRSELLKNALERESTGRRRNYVSKAAALAFSGGRVGAGFSACRLSLALAVGTPRSTGCAAKPAASSASLFWAVLALSNSVDKKELSCASLQPGIEDPSPRRWMLSLGHAPHTQCKPLHQGFAFRALPIPRTSGATDAFLPIQAVRPTRCWCPTGA